MDASYQAGHTPQLQILTDAQIDRIYQGTLECLQRTGVEIRNATARKLLTDAGARADGTRIRIPSHIIEDTLATVPESFKIWGRDQEHHIQIEPGSKLFGPGPTCTYFIDPQTGQRRKTRRGDPSYTARVCQELENIDYVMSLGLIDDVTPNLAAVYEFAEMITHTLKPVLAWAFDLNHLKDIYRIALTLTGSEKKFRQHPIFGFFSTYQAPLIQTDKDLANCLWASTHGIPVIYLGGGIAGITGPVTGAGLLVVQLSNALSGLAILQLNQPGAPICIGGVPLPMDLRTARPVYGGPEMSLYGAACSEVLQSLGVPFMGTAGASEAKLVDQQAAIESTMQVVLASLSGAAMVHDTGFLDCADTGSLEMLVMNDEIIAMTKRVMRGLEVSDDTLMLDLIDQVGPGGEFASAIETARRCRQEIFNSKLMDREPWQDWEQNGSASMLDRVRQRLQYILSNDQPLSVSQKIAEKIESILAEAEKREGSIDAN
ncbi:MAG: trimethylamine methyltransferase family protein [Deltaproteobacteria bacterium]|jgi:trimethylamine--corrinoid protein Co-methyltransferase|nr:trimethylamine methyltransferase family protein [Deltaproteobacteria bacterium]